MCLPEKHKYKYLKLVPLNATRAVFLSLFFYHCPLRSHFPHSFLPILTQPRSLIAQIRHVPAYAGHVYVCFMHTEVKGFTPQEHMVPLGATLSLLRTYELEWSFEDNNV